MHTMEEVLPYNPGTRDWVESTQSETPEAPTQSERAYSKREKAEREGQRGTVDSTWFVSVSGKKLARETFSGLGTLTSVILTPMYYITNLM